MRPISLLLLATTITFNAMSNDTNTMTPEELKKMQERAEAQTKAVEAEKKLIDAQLALDEAKKKLAAAAAAPDAAAQALATAKTEKELAEAQKAKADAQIAAFKAKFGGVPDSGIEGEVTLGDKAGSLEMGLLAYRALDAAAARVAESVKPRLHDKTGKPLKDASVYAFSATQVPNFQAVSTFMVQRAAVSEALKRADESAQAALAPQTETESFTPAMVGIALESITKLLGFFRSDFKVAGADITLDDVALVQAVVGQGLGVLSHMPSMYSPAAVTGAPEIVTRELSALSQQVSDSRKLAAKLDELIAQREKQAAASTDKPSLKASLEREIAALRDITGRFKAATTAYDTLLGRLLAPDEAAGTMLRDFAVFDALKKPGGHLLVLKVLRSGGSNYTEKNLWTFFGKMPFYVAGGTVVAFTLFKGDDGQVLASGVIPVHGGFESVKDVPSNGSWMGRSGQ